MTVESNIFERNADAIGRPTVDRKILSFYNSDRDQFIQYFAYLDEWMTVEILDETVQVWHRLGKVLSIEYLSCSVENGNYVLVWKVQYKNDENLVHWTLFLNDSQEEVKVNGFAFDR